MKEFLEEAAFDREQYETYLRRIRYDDRDEIMYENMLRFLWETLLENVIADRAGLCAAYTRFNQQMIARCYHNLPYAAPYAHIRRAWQSVIHLIDGDLNAGLSELSKLGEEFFVTDGRAPKTVYTGDGRCYPPVSRLFLLYNYEKMFRKRDADRAARLREDYPYAFRTFGDGTHDGHDAFLEEQLTRYENVIFYPVYSRVYRMPGGRREAFLYCDTNAFLPIPEIH